MTRKSTRRPPGELRQSQVVMTFGPGSMLDLPSHSVLVGGLEYWSAGGNEISEPRLAAKLSQQLGIPNVRLVTPPPEQDDPAGPPTGITCLQFPEWFITQDLEAGEHSAGSGRSRMLVHRKALTRGRFIDRDRKKRAVVPVRFVRACRCGHIGDIDWYVFVHNGPSECANQHRQLWIDERGTSGDLTEVWIRCECGKAERSMAEAAGKQDRALGLCDGHQPWLGPYMKERCNERNRLLIRTASNAYFPLKLTVISLPDRDETVRQAIEAAWEFLEEVQDLEQLKYERRKSKVKAALDGVTDAEALAEIQRRKSGLTQVEKPVKVPELETLIASADELGEDRPQGDFFARALPRAVWDQPWMKPISRVVLVHRLREVAAQFAFTRFEAEAPNTEGELEMGVRRATLARDVTWLPTIENRGEGIFLQFDDAAIAKWLERPAVKSRGLRLEAGFGAWSAERPGNQRKFPGLPYIMLHSFSHLLITAIALECGYPASSIRERIYAIPTIGYGVLLYTGTADAEGTLGGLIQVGRRIHEHVREALELGELCSNDPVCAQHAPEGQHERRFLHGAACHGCLLIAETSCEYQNDYLDRALVLRTVDGLGAEFITSDLLTGHSSARGAR